MFFKSGNYPSLSPSPDDDPSIRLWYVKDSITRMGCQHPTRNTVFEIPQQTVDNKNKVCYFHNMSMQYITLVLIVISRFR
jgi:hypothetical protein